MAAFREYKILFLGNCGIAGKPENALAEVLNFIQFIELKAGKDTFVKASQKLSERSFEKIWSNEEDAVHDNL